MTLGVPFIWDPMGYFCLSTGHHTRVARFFCGKKVWEGLESNHFMYFLNYMEGKKLKSV